MFDFRDVLEVKIRSGVVLHVQLHLGPNLTSDVHVDVLIEVETRNVALSLWQKWIIYT